MSKGLDFCIHFRESIFLNMKKLVLLLFATVLMFDASAQQSVLPNPSGAKIHFESEVADYGTIHQDADGTKEFKFKNVGKELLIVSDVKSSCGCLVASGPKEPIGPGKSGVIRAHYDTKRVGKFEKTITVYSNDVERPTLTLKVKGEVLAPK